ncbi:glycosyltransferase family 39 protein [Neisseriaceae bacterium TC5R-5]|nr:glycosyltransferase family 39 protein [Neisseriaceae bacterium TC5R-5]
MLTYSQHTQTLTKPTEKPWVLLLLCFVWLWPGIIGHDPWKPDEPYVLAVVQQMLDTGHLLLPNIQGVAYLEHPPLYYWVAALMARLFSPWLLPLHDAARLATPLFMSLALLLAGMSGRHLIGRRHGRSVVMVLIGCIGLIQTGHHLTPSVASFTGFAAAFYALVLAIRSPGLAGVVLAVASSVIFLSSSLLELLLLWIVVLLLPIFSSWRNKYYLVTIFIALLIAIPLLIIWPTMLAKAYPTVFQLWWRDYALGPLNGFSASQVLPNLVYHCINIVWFSFPAWPLAAWSLYRHRHQLAQPRLQLPLLFFSVLLILLVLSNRPNMAYAMPLLLPLAILSAVELDSLRRNAAAFLNWFGLMTFGLFALLVWAGWAAMNFGWPAKLAGRAQYFSPYYQPYVSTIAAVCALLATAVWLWAVTRKNLRGRQAITNWAAGLTLLWGLAMTLWLPWFDAAKSYRPVVQKMLRNLPADANCVAVADDQLLAMISWRYYGNIQLVPVAANTSSSCDYQLLVRPESQGMAEPGWQVLWYGSRPREQNMTFGLLRRSSVK